MSMRSLGVILVAVAASSWLALARPALQQPAAPQANDSLDGTWDLVSLIEDGKPVSSEIVKQTMIQNSRVVISGQLLAFNKPDGSTKTLAFVLDPTASPKRVDLAGSINLGNKGIYLRDSDTLLICFPMSESDARPAEFASLPGKNTVMMTFARVKAPASPAIKPAPVLEPPVAARTSDDDLQTALIGTWGHQNDEKIVKGTMNPDNTFSILTTYKKGLKKLFDAEDRSSGTWRVKDGMVIMTTTASTERSQIGQVASYRIQSINASEVIYIDNKTGSRRIEWKLR